MQLLVCPICKGPLTHLHDTRELLCPADRLAFLVRDSIAVMLENEGRSVDRTRSMPSSVFPAPAPNAPDTPRRASTARC